MGIAIGLFLDSILVIATRGWLLFVFPLLIVPVGVGAIVGALVLRSKPISLSSRAVAFGIFAVIVLWFVCATGPIAARWIQLYTEAKSLPMCPGCQKEYFKIEVLGFDSNPGYSMVLRCDSDPSDCIRYYRRELPLGGWSRPSTSQKGGRNWHEFFKPHRSLTLGEVLPGDCPDGKQNVDYHGIVIGVNCH